jgi:hypothetical protein
MDNSIFSFVIYQFLSDTPVLLKIFYNVTIIISKEGRSQIMETKTKAQVGRELLAALDAYIDTVMAEREEEKRRNRETQVLKYIEEHKNDAIHIPKEARGPYAQALREELGIQ